MRLAACGGGGGGAAGESDASLLDRIVKTATALRPRGDFKHVPFAGQPAPPAGIGARKGGGRHLLPRSSLTWHAAHEQGRIFSTGGEGSQS